MAFSRGTNFGIRSPRSAAAMVFDPLAYSPVVWTAPRLAAYSDDGTTPSVEDGLIKRLTDLSGTGSHATQTTSGSRPALDTQNGVAWANYTGTKYLDYASRNWGSSWTDIVVCRFSNSISSFGRIFEAIGYNAHSCLSVWNNTYSPQVPNRFGFEVNSSGMPGNTGKGAAFGGEPIILVSRYNGTTRDLRINGTQYLSAASATAPSSTTGAGRLGAYVGGVSYGWPGHIGDHLHFNSYLSDASIALYESYLASIYKIALAPTSARYVMPYFAGDGDETLYVAATNNGTRFSRIEASYTPSLGSVRDPRFIKRGSTWLLAHTSGSFSTPTTSFEVASSSNTLGADGCAFTTVANVDCTDISGVNQVWSPGPMVDPADDSEHVFFGASTNGNSGPFTLYEKHPTNAGRTTWSAAVAVAGSGIPSNCIEAHVWKGYGGFYWMIAKDETTKYGVLCKSSSLLTGWTRVKSGDWMGIGTAEGFSKVDVDGQTWVYFDDYQNHWGGGVCRVLASTTDLENATFGTPEQITTSSTSRNGGAYDLAA